MPSALPYERTALTDLSALSLYSRTYRGKEWQVKVKNAASARRDLRLPFLNYPKFFLTPQRLFCGKLRPLANFLHDLYTSTAAPFRYIAALRDPEKVGACPYCGLSKNITVDHYLPRSHRAFPHFSFLSLNLVPSCSDCQSSKSSFYPQQHPVRQTPAKASRAKLLLARRSDKQAASKNARPRRASPAPSDRCIRGSMPLQTESRVLPQETRRFIHPYFDRFLKNCAFDVELAWDHGLPEIHRFIWKPHLTAAQRALVTFHLDKLKVKDRARGILRRRYRAFAKVIAGKTLSRVQIENHLGIRLSTIKSDTGIANSIEAKCLEAILRDRAAIADLVVASSKPRPSPLELVATAVPKVERQRRRMEARGHRY